ncbi:T9SS type A sorting domain-containing protein [Flavobacterium algicola]|uniref:T9SS type A sorting domain-containing protein n=1 Tax=Flavobacterium algicola TaxID=556529 RepID=UPI001EFC8714|nr:T9SS type A sorting domain-containing protein [Flavobacterium algicola]MCG9794031.1 T9SS type A sorting domain-containing protein [Flavobacterium algicola]
MKTTIVSGFLLLTVLAFGQGSGTAKWSKMGENKSVTFKQVQTDFNKYWSKRKPQKGQGYKIYKRWENQIEPRVYPSGNMSLLSSNYVNFMEWQNTVGTKQIAAKNKISLKTALSGWTSLNGNSVPAGYDSGSGRLSFVTFDPIASQTMYVGSPDGGLWKTVNEGSSWTTHTDFLTVIGCSGLVIHPSQTNIMYLATGDRESDRKSIGVLKSTDGGENWNTTALTWAATPADDYKITKIVMDPTNPLIMMLATNKGVFKTTDGWATSENITTPFDNGEFYDIEFKPGISAPDSNVVYASTYNEIFVSTDNGDNWTESTGLPTSDVARVELAVTPHNNEIVYAIAGNSESGLKGVYKSENSGVSFALVYETSNTNPNLLHSDADPLAATSGINGGQAGHDLAIAVSPLNSDLITVGGINQWQSTDGGVSWARITHWSGIDENYPGSAYPETETKPYIHADIQYIAYSPHENTTLYTTCDGGISRGIDDGQSTWVDLTNNIAVGQQTSISLSATNADKYFTGLQDIGSLITSSPGQWSVLSGGDGEDGFVDRTNENILVSSTVNGAFYRTKNGVKSQYSELTGSEWFTPIHQDPTVDNLVYVGGRPTLYKSTDILTNDDYEEPTWVALGTPHAGNNILRFEIAPSNNQVIYAITDDKISKSSDAGVSWMDITGTLPVGAAKLKNLAVSNTDASKVWVVFSGYNAASKVFKTIDGGAHWTDVNSTALPNLPINTIVYVKGSDNDVIYVGADIGVYSFDNAQTTWTSFSADLPKNSVQDLEIYYSTSTTGKLRAATYGRGSWESSITFTSATLSTNEIAMTSAEAPIIYPNPVSDAMVNVKLQDNSKIYEYVIYDLKGAALLKGVLDVNNTKIAVPTLTSGIYFIKMINGTSVSNQKIVIKN